MDNKREYLGSRKQPELVMEQLDSIITLGERLKFASAFFEDEIAFFEEEDLEEFNFFKDYLIEVDYTFGLLYSTFVYTDISRVALNTKMKAVDNHLLEIEGYIESVNKF